MNQNDRFPTDSNPPPKPAPAPLVDGYAQAPQPYGPPPSSAYGPPPQPYAQAPMHPYGAAPYPPQYPQQQHPGYGPAPYGAPGFAPHGAAPINIVVQNTNTNTVGGGLIRTGNRSRGVAALLALFLGGLGAHKFYLGQPLMGLFYLFFCWTFLPMIAAFFEALGYLFMSEQSFDLKYNARLA